MKHTWIARSLAEINFHKILKNSSGFIHVEYNNTYLEKAYLSQVSIVTHGGII